MAPRLVQLNIPAGVELDEFIRRLARAKDQTEMQQIVEKVQDLYDPKKEDELPKA